MERKSITQADVAKRAGVTRSVVSYVLNGTNRSVAPVTKRKILNAIEELGYRPNKFAQILQVGKEALAKNQIGVILYSDELFFRQYYTEILSGIYAAAHKSAYHIHFVRFFSELKDPVLFNSLIHTEEVCGVILLGVNQILKTDEDYAILDKIKDRLPQVVCVDWKMHGFPSILFDRHGASYKAVQFLFSKGYSDIAFIGHLDERVKGFQQAFLEKDSGLLSDLEIIGALDMASGYAVMPRLGHMPRAICTGSDEIAIGVLKYLHEHGLSVPEQVALISIDNLEMAEYTNPPLTTVNVQKKSMGEKAVEMIMSGFAQTGDSAVSMFLPTNIVERDSC